MQLIATHRKDMFQMPRYVICLLALAIITIIFAIIFNGVVSKRKTKESQIKRSLNDIPEIIDYHLEYKLKTKHRIDGVGKYESPTMTWRDWILPFQTEQLQWKKYDASRVTIMIKNINFVITDIEANGIHGYLIELPYNLINTQKLIINPQKVMFKEDCDGKFIYGYDTDKAMSCIYCFGKDNENNDRHGVITENMLKEAYHNPIDFQHKVKTNIVNIIKDISIAMC